MFRFLSLDGSSGERLDWHTVPQSMAWISEAGATGWGDGGKQRKNAVIKTVSDYVSAFEFPCCTKLQRSPLSVISCYLLARHDFIFITSSRETSKHEIRRSCLLLGARWPVV